MTIGQIVIAETDQCI